MHSVIIKRWIVQSNWLCFLGLILTTHHMGCFPPQVQMYSNSPYMYGSLWQNVKICPILQDHFAHACFPKHHFSDRQMVQLLCMKYFLSSGCDLPCQQGASLVDSGHNSTHQLLDCNKWRVQQLCRVVAYLMCVTIAMGYDFGFLDWTIHFHLGCNYSNEAHEMIISMIEPCRCAKNNKILTKNENKRSMRFFGLPIFNSVIMHGHLIFEW